MNIDTILESLQAAFPDDTLDPETWPIDETVVTLRPESIHRAVRLLIERFNLRHLSTITGEDTGAEILILYHFWDRQGLTLRTALPLQKPRIATLTALIPGAVFYEREVSEMPGVNFADHPNPAALLLPDDWDDSPPLRKERP